MLVIIDEPLLQVGYRDGPERKQRRGARRQLEIDLDADLFGALPIVRDRLADGPAVLAVVDPPASPVLVDGDAPDAAAAGGALAQFAHLGTFLVHHLCTKGLPGERKENAKRLI